MVMQKILSISCISERLPVSLIIVRRMMRKLLFFLLALFALFTLLRVYAYDLPSDLPKGETTLSYLPQQCLYFFPLPQGQGSFRPTFGT